MSATTAPLGFERYRRGTRCLVVDAAFADAVRRLGLLEPGVLEDLIQRGSRAGGRSRNSVLALPGRTERLHLRPFHHGGLLGELRGDRLLGLGRPLSELRVSARLRAAGIWSIWERPRRLSAPRLHRCKDLKSSRWPTPCQAQ